MSWQVVAIHSFNSFHVRYLFKVTKDSIVTFSNDKKNGLSAVSGSGLESEQHRAHIASQHVVWGRIALVSVWIRCNEDWWKYEKKIQTHSTKICFDQSFAVKIFWDFLFNLNIRLRQCTNENENPACKKLVPVCEFFLYMITSIQICCFEVKSCQCDTGYKGLILAGWWNSLHPVGNF